jgi:hypothetical protein
MQGEMEYSICRRIAAAKDRRTTVIARHRLRNLAEEYEMKGVERKKGAKSQIKEQ